MRKALLMLIGPNSMILNGTRTLTQVVPAYDVVATGGVDDLVKVFAYEDGELRLRHKLGDHSLGVVSVALSKEAKYLGRATDTIGFAAQTQETLLEI